MDAAEQKLVPLLPSALQVFGWVPDPAAFAEQKFPGWPAAGPCVAEQLPLAWPLSWPALNPVLHDCPVPPTPPGPAPPPTEQTIPPVPPPPGWADGWVEHDVGFGSVVTLWLLQVLPTALLNALQVVGTVVVGDPFGPVEQYMAPFELWFAEQLPAFEGLRTEHWGAPWPEIVEQT